MKTAFSRLKRQYSKEGDGVSDSINVILEPNEKKDCWDKFKILGIALVAPAVAFSGHWYSQAIKEQEVRAKYVELAVDILKQEALAEKEPIRTWAIDVVNEYSKVKLPESAKIELETTPILKEKLNVSFDLHMTQGSKSIRFTHVNHGKLNTVLDRVTFSGGDKSDCSLTYTPKTVMTGESSYYTDIASAEELASCLDVDNLTKDGYKLYGASTSHSLDIGPLKDKVHRYSTVNHPFFVVAEYSNEHSKAKEVFGASLHFFK